MRNKNIIRKVSIKRIPICLTYKLYNMVIEFEVKKQCHRIIKMAKLRSHCTCWGPWFKDR